MGGVDGQRPYRGIFAILLHFCCLALTLPLAGSAATPPTFNKDVAPIVYQHCTACHRDGQAAPFSLRSYEDVRRHAAETRDAVQSGSMPPWPPDSRCGDFAGQRRLTAAERNILLDWINTGAQEGDSKDRPPEPRYDDGWALGAPDLVITMPRPYLLEAEGADVYRNFLIHVPTTTRRFVRAVQFKPGNPRIVHHAFIKVDSTGAARNLESSDGPPGFAGMNIPADMPGGQFLTWHPGESASESPPGAAWPLPPNSDLVLQLHLNRSGKPEELQSALGLYFTDEAPTNLTTKIVLTSLNLDFPPGRSNIVVTDSYRLPVGVQLLAVLPHAHYLAREMECSAEFPDGQQACLLRILNWDFRWQGSYRYSAPISLPRGTTVRLKYTYDNSSNNLANPNQPPRRVLYGPQSSDEMCELWLQLQLTPEAQRILQPDNEARMFRIFLEGAEHRVLIQPGSAEAHTELGALLMRRFSKRAVEEVQRAIRLDPNYAPAHYQLGVHWRWLGRFDDAKRELETAVRLNPREARAYGHLGFVLAERGDASGAEKAFERALTLNPQDSIVRDALAELRQIMRKQSPPNRR